MINDNLQNRRIVIAAIFVSIVVIYILRLFTLQVLETKYKTGAESNAYLKKTIFPPRGLIYDRNDSLLVYNKPAYDVAFINKEIHNFDTISFCKDLGITKECFIARMSEVKDKKKNVGYSAYSPQIFMSQLNVKEIASVQQSMYKYPGFYIQNRTLREYKYPYAAHVLGSVGEVSRKKIEDDPYYKQGDFAGITGVENTYEDDLKGEKGMEIYLRDVQGRIKGRLEDGKRDIEAKVGSDLKLTLDINLQALGEKLMTGKVGSIVAIEPKTGEILAMVTNPTFNPAILVGKERSKNYQLLLDDPTKPLINRATQAQYSPGSTIKPFQALVELDMGGIYSNTYYPCAGKNSSPVRCTHFHGSPVSLLSAIEESCNPYFWNAFKATLEKNGYGDKNKNFKAAYDQWREEFMSFGFGEKFAESDVFQQSKGNVPSVKLFDKIYGEKGWRSSTIRSLSIGQGEISVTPLQLASAVCVIANRGYYITPHLNKNDSLLKYKHEVKIKKSFYSIVDEGMWRVNQFGTAAGYNIPGIVWCGKTGTVQNSHGKDHAFYIGYAPRENPKIALMVMVENAGYGSTYAAPIASLMTELYLKKKIERVDLLEKTSGKVTNRNVKEY